MQNSKELLLWEQKEKIIETVVNDRFLEQVMQSKKYPDKCRFPVTYSGYFYFKCFVYECSQRF